MHNLEGFKNALKQLPGLGTTDGEDKPKAHIMMWQPLFGSEASA